MKVKTCCKFATGSIFGIMFATKMKSFQKISTVKTGISYCHKMIVFCLKPQKIYIKYNFYS